MAEEISFSSASKAVGILENQALILNGEINDLKRQLLVLQKQISAKEAQRTTCLATASALIDYQINSRGRYCYA